MENLSKVFQKQNKKKQKEKTATTKKKKKHTKKLSFITQFKIGCLLPFTSCRKVLGKMSALPDTYITDLTKKFSIWR